MATATASPSAHRVDLGHIARPIVLLLILIGAGYWYWQSQVGSQDGALIASGTIESDETNVASEIAGRVASIAVDEGASVAAGAPLFTLDDTVWRAQIGQARAAVGLARANLALVKAGARTEEIRAAEATLEQTAAMAAASERALAHARTLRGNPQELNARISQAEASVAATQARLDQVKAGPRAGELATARTARDQARSAASQLEATLAALEKIARESVAAAEGRLRLAKAGPRAEDIRAAEVTLEQARNARWGQQIERDAICGRGPGALCDAASARVAAAESAVSAAASQLDKARNGALPDEIRLVESAVAQAQADLAAKLEVAGPSLASARSAVDATSARVRDLESGATAQELAIAQSGLDGAQRNLSDLRAMRDDPQAANAQVDAAQGQATSARAAESAAKARFDALKAGPTDQQVAVAQATVAQAEAALAALEVQAARTSIVAPVAGVVTRRTARIGETVSPGVPVVSVAPLAELRLTVYVPEDRIGHVALNAPVSVSVDTFGAEAFGGTISYISPRAEFTPRNVQTQSDRAKTVFAVRVRLPNPDGRLKPGMFADARFGT